jgi:pimeloyl-ACP methyl ester carboxylesterase
VIYQHGLGGDRVESNSCGPRSATRLAEKGFYVLRYDSRGHGVSAGEFYQVTWEGWLQDLRRALERLSEIEEIDVNRVALLSTSAGAKMACFAANRTPQIRGCVLWSPILVDGDTQAAPQRFRRHPSGKLVTPVKSLWLGMDYFVDVKRKQYDFLAEFKNCSKPVLVFFGDQERDLAGRDLIEQMVCGQPEKTVIEIEGGHAFTYKSVAKAIELSATWLTDLFDQSAQ